MQAAVEYLFGAASFMPHGYCLMWRPDLVAVHAVSDLVTAVSYFSIPAALFVLTRHRRDLSFRWMFGLFVAFIFACGTTHLLSLVTLWQPVYGLQGLVKAAAATISAATAIILWPLLPRALALPSPAMLAQTNRRLEDEVQTRIGAERALREAHLDLEQHVADRTQALAAANARLEEEVAERRRAEAGLRAREARLQAILDTAPEAIVVVDDRGVIESFSPSAEAMFGYVAAEIVGGNVGDLVPGTGGEGSTDGFARHLATDGGRVNSVERVVKGRRKDGSEFPIEVAVGGVASNGRSHFVAYIRDLTARERMEGELRQAQKMEAIGQLTGGVAHDFNNLLTVVLGNLEMLEERLGSENDLLLVREAGYAVRSGAELTARLLAFARRQPLDPRPVDLRRQVEEVAALLRRALGETIEVRTVVPDDLAPALVDSSQLQNSILNLALNARDAMPKGGTLVLRAATTEIDPDHVAAQVEDVRPGRYVLLSVTDTGVGMPTDVRDRAFEPFFTTKAAGTGSGLGLSMVYGFARQSGGHARIYSEPGHGTTVRLYLPQAPEATPAAPNKPHLLVKEFSGRGETILVAEDDELVRRYVATRLETLGYRVLEAEDGPTALRVFEENEAIDLLFTDVVMPGGMTGLDLARLILEQRPALPVVYTSAYAQPELLQRGLTEGGQWLRKPHTALDLARTLRQALDAAQEAEASPAELPAASG